MIQNPLHEKVDGATFFRIFSVLKYTMSSAHQLTRNRHHKLSERCREAWIEIVGVALFLVFA